MGTIWENIVLKKLNLKYSNNLPLTLRSKQTYSLSEFRRKKILKVSKFQKQVFLFSFEPKNEQNYFLNFALASKMSQIKKL
jgi:hypothetical protein